MVINGVREEDYDKYRCEARNEIGQGKHTVIELRRELHQALFP